MFRTALAIGTVAGALPGATFAGDLSVPVAEPAPIVVAPAPSPDLIFKLRGGIAVVPDYIGSSDYTFGPDLGFSLQYARLFGREFGSAGAEPRFGTKLRGSFRYVDERSADDNSELAGLDDLDTSVELGLGLGYSSYRFDAFADIRYGVVGHEAWVGELGADVKAYPTDRLTLSMGPRLFVGSDRYADTYFGISSAEAAGSAFSAYDANGGLLSAGLELGATYEINDNWGVEGAITWDRLSGDADDSPIVQQGDRDQYGLRVGITRQITLDF